MKYLLLCTLFLFVSCKTLVSTKPAKTEQGGAEKIQIANRVIFNQIKRYPALVDEAFTVTTTDSIFIPADSIFVQDTLQDLPLLDGIVSEMYTNDLQLEKAQERLSNLKYVKDKEIQSIKKVIRNYKVTSDSLFSLYRETARLTNQVGIIEKDAFNLHYKIINGELSIKAKLKEKYQITSKTTTTNKIKYAFWQDDKFYYLLFGLLVLIYFIGDILKNILRRIVNTIIDLIKRLFKII